MNFKLEKRMNEEDASSSSYVIGVMIHVARRALIIYYENDAVFES